MAARQTNLMKHAPFSLGVLLCAAPFALYPPDGWGFPDSAAFGVFFILSWTSFTIWYWTIWSSWVMLARAAVGIYVGFFTCVFVTLAIWQLRTALAIAF